MAQEVVVLTDAAGASAAGAADDVVRYSDAFRYGLGTMWIVGGFLAAGACIVIPVVHLVSTWALPLLGIMLGMRTFKRRVILHDVKGECPACHQRIELVGGSIGDATWQKCPNCQAPLTIRPQTESGVPAPADNSH